MDKQIEALKQALEALSCVKDMVGHPDNIEFIDSKIAAIREALADSALDRMAENARELGLDYEPIVERVENSVGMGHKAWDMVEPKELAKAFHEALAEQPAQQQEPVIDKSAAIRIATALGWVPPRKPLTDEQAKAITYVGPVYAPDGLVTRSPLAYRKELEAHRLDAIRKTEAAHGIKGDA